MKLYACDRCDRLVKEDKIHFIEIDTDPTLGTTASTHDKILELELCDKCYDGIISFCRNQSLGGWREFLYDKNKQ